MIPNFNVKKIFSNIPSRSSIYGVPSSTTLWQCMSAVMPYDRMPFDIIRMLHQWSQDTNWRQKVMHLKLHLIQSWRASLGTCFYRIRSNWKCTSSGTLVQLFQLVWFPGVTYKHRCCLTPNYYATNCWKCQCRYIQIKITVSYKLSISLVIIQVLSSWAWEWRCWIAGPYILYCMQ